MPRPSPSHSQHLGNLPFKASSVLGSSVGGGELWDDAYRAVDDANYERDAAGMELYELFGGGAGSVSAAGGWMAGGGLEEHFWGTDGLAKLEAIKAKVDPQGLFQCQKCVGFKGPVRDQ